MHAIAGLLTAIGLVVLTIVVILLAIRLGTLEKKVRHIIRSDDIENQMEEIIKKLDKNGKLTKCTSFSSDTGAWDCEKIKK